MKKPKVLFVGTGGTIASVKSKKGLIPEKSAEDFIKEVPTIASIAGVVVEEFVNIDSTNFKPFQWQGLCEYIKPFIGNSPKYDAIIILHGTDTMAYTASAIAMTLGPYIQVPIVFTGSQLPFGNIGTDARFNIENAVMVATQACKENIAEVMIVFNDKVLRASRTIKKSEAQFNAFESPAFPPLAIIDADGIKFIAETKKASDNFALDEKREIAFDKSVLVLELVPGLKPDALRTILFLRCFDAVILKSFGTGNVPDDLIPVIKEATTRGFPVVVATQFIGGKTLMGVYEPGQKALDAGAIPAGDMTSPMTYLKLMWALKQSGDLSELKKLMAADIVGEITKK